MKVMAKGKAKTTETANERVQKKLDELGEFIIKELETGSLESIIDCGWYNSKQDIEYEIDVVVKSTGEAIKVSRLATLEIDINLEAEN